MASWWFDEVLQSMELYIIRHGQSANNAAEEERKPRVFEPPLTEAGRRQVALVGERFRDLSWAWVHPGEAEAKKTDGLTRLYTSPMLRALETAEAVGRGTGLIPHVWVDIHEVGGVWLDSSDGGGPSGLPGQKRSEIRDRFPHFVLPPEIREEGWWNRPYEPDAGGYARAERVAEELRELADTDERVGIVSHGGFGSYLLDVLMGLPFIPELRFSMNNTSVARVDLVPSGVRLRFSNRVDHLPGELIT